MQQVQDAANPTLLLATLRARVTSLLLLLLVVHHYLRPELRLPNFTLATLDGYNPSVYNPSSILAKPLYY